LVLAFYISFAREFIMLTTNNKKRNSFDVNNFNVDKVANGNNKKAKYDVSSVPIVQFGTYKIKGPECYQACLTALKLGYKGLDTASVYANEKEVGQAIQDSGVDRKEIFVQTKLWRSFTGKNPKNGKPKCDPELRKSLKQLGLAYVDMWLMHWPGPGRHLNYPPVKMGMDRPKFVKDKTKIPKSKTGVSQEMVPEDWTPAMRLETYADMAANVGPAGSGKPVRAAGVCNFSPRQLKELLEFCDTNGVVRPALVQNECHPLLQAREVRKICQEEGIVFQAYASLGAGQLGLLEKLVVKQVASRRGVTEGQVLLRWAVQGGCTVLPKSVREERMKSNLDVLDWKLEKEDMEMLDGMEEGIQGPNTIVGEDGSTELVPRFNSNGFSSEKGVQGQNTMVGWLREHDPDFY